MLKALGVFVALFALDFVWAKYTFAMQARDALTSSGFAAVLILLSGIAAVGYTRHPWLLLPAMAGAFGGTWFAVVL